MKLTKLISKNILNICDGKLCGTVYDIVIKENKIIFLKIFDSNEEEYLVDTKKIYSVGSDIIIIKNSTAFTQNLNLNENLLLSPIEKSIYTLNGDFFGKVQDLEIDNNFNIINYKINDKTIDYKNVLIGLQVGIFDENTKKLRIKYFKPLIPKATTKKTFEKVDIQTNTDLDSTRWQNISKHTNTIETPYIEGVDDKKEQNKSGKKNFENKPSYILNDSPSPQRIIGLGSGSFLLKRKATKTIFGINNEVLIREGSTITKRVLDSCTLHGKLLELALYSADNK